MSSKNNDNTGNFMEDFDPYNMTKKQHDFMLAQVYDGYATRTVDHYEMRGAGDGRQSRKVGTKEVFSPGKYKDNEAWQKVAEAANISNINNKTDVAQMYQFIEDANNKKDLDKRFAALQASNTEDANEPAAAQEKKIYLEPSFQEAAERSKKFEDDRKNSSTGPFAISNYQEMKNRFNVTPTDLDEYNFIAPS